MSEQAIPHGIWTLVKGAQIKVKHNAGHTLYIRLRGDGFLINGAEDADWQIEPTGVRRPPPADPTVRPEPTMLKRTVTGHGWIDFHPDPRRPRKTGRLARVLTVMWMVGAVAVTTCALILGAALLARGDWLGAAWMTAVAGVASVSLGLSVRDARQGPKRDEQRRET
jgi:hypothetical protein